VLRSILVALDGSPWSEAATTLALDWAGRSGARVLGLGILDEPAIERGEPVPMGAYEYKKHRDQRRLGDAHRRVLDLLDDFRVRSTALGIDAIAVEDVGDPADHILREAHRCDIVVLGRETHFRFETPDRADATLAQVIRTSPRPIVVVPRKLRAGGGVMVAYGGGREAARTLQTFTLLGLGAGQDVAVVTVHRERAQAEATANLAGDFLTAHGMSPTLCPIPSDAAPADVLLEELRRRQAGLLVMGAHAHHPFRDLFTTSVTRAVLAECAVPTFVGA
jgi:nucleotide-binding universal stress UspA family protein